MRPPVERITVDEYLRHEPPSGRKRKKPSRAEAPGKGRFRCVPCGQVMECSSDQAVRHVQACGGGRLQWLFD